MAVGPTIVQPPKTDGIPQGGTVGPTDRLSTGQVTPTKPVESHRLAQASSWFGETDNLTSRQNRTRCVTETGPRSSIGTRPGAKRFLGVRSGAGRRITGLRRFLRGGVRRPRSGPLPAPVGFGRRLRSRGSARSAPGRPRPAGCRRPRSRSRVRSR